MANKKNDEYKADFEEKEDMLNDAESLDTEETVPDENTPDELQDEELDEETRKMLEEFMTDDDAIPASSYFLYSNLPINADADKEEMIEIMDMYRSSEEGSEERNIAGTRMCGILHSYIISVLQTKYSPFMPRYRDDLISVSYIGVMKGLEKFDPRKGATTTWFWRYIVHECNEYIDKQITHSSAHYTSAYKKIQACIERKKAEDIPYTVKDIYLETGVPIKTIEAVLKIKDVKMTPISKEAGDMDLPAELGNPSYEAEEQETLASMYEAINSALSDKEKTVICYQYGFTGEILTGKEIDRRFGIPANQVSAIKKNAEHKIKKYMLKTETDKVPEGSVPIGELLFGNKSNDFLKKLKKSQWL